jgi:hypothetical protein
MQARLLNRLLRVHSHTSMSSNTCAMARLLSLQRRSDRHDRRPSRSTRAGLGVSLPLAGATALGLDASRLDWAPRSDRCADTGTTGP